MTEYNLPDRAFKVEMTADSLKRNPETGDTALTWAGLDTAWNVLREYAMRTVLFQIREAAAGKGLEWPDTDDEVFDRIQAAQGLAEPPTYLDLAPGAASDPMSVPLNMAGASLQSIMDILHHESQHVLDDLHGGTLLAQLAPDSPDEGDPIEGDGYRPED